jgi:hypothetical protein
MAAISNVEEFRAYVRTALGDPVVCSQIANTQIDQIIDDSVQEFQRYMYSEGAYESYLVFPVSAGVDTYTVSGVQDVTGVEFDDNYNINVLHSDMNMLWSNGQWSNYLLGGHNEMALTSYEIAMQYLKDVRTTFGRMYRVHYREQAEILNLIPTPIKDGLALLRCYKKEDAENLYNHVLLKKLVVARSMIQLGINLGRYNMEMPGGGTVNHDAILQKGETDQEKILEQMRLESEPIDPIWG